jgi:hypothetical protein
MATVRAPRDEEAWTAAKELAAVSLSGGGALGLGEGGTDRGGERICYCTSGASAEEEVKRESKNSN